MIETPLDLAFKGTRDYLHGADLYHAIHSACVKEGRLTDLTDIRLKLTRFYRKPLLLKLSDRLETDMPTPGWSCRSLDRRWHGWLGERSDAAPLGSVPFDETGLRACLDFSGREVSLRDGADYRPMECAIIAGRMLLQNEMPAPAGGQWAFVRLALRNDPERAECREMRVGIDSVLGDRFARLKLSTRAGELGLLEYARVTQVAGQAEFSLGQGRA